MPVTQTQNLASHIHVWSKVHAGKLAWGNRVLFWMSVKTTHYCFVRYVYPEWQENLFLLACALMRMHGGRECVLWMGNKAALRLSPLLFCKWSWDSRLICCVSVCERSLLCSASARCREEIRSHAASSLGPESQRLTLRLTGKQMSPQAIIRPL